MKDKAILVIDMPKSCWECPCLDSEWGNCHVLGDDKTCMPNVYDKDSRLDKCPLKPVPHVRVEKIDHFLELGASIRKVQFYVHGFVDCLTDILGEDDESSSSD